MITPESKPIFVATHIPMLILSMYVIMSVSTAKAIQVKYVPKFRALPGFPLFPTLTTATPIREAITPRPAKISGIFSSPTGLVLPSSAPRIIAATTLATYESNRSAPIPATSPTLSPTLSAMTAGFLGSSSGMPISTFPTRSAATSAVFV